MRRVGDATASWLMAGLQRAALVVQLARAHRERLLVFLIPLILLTPVVIVAGTWRYEQATRPQVVAAEPERPWQYTLLCEECGHRVRLSESPYRTREKRAGFFQCPQCGAFKASCYRWGSLSLSPGGL